MRRYIFNDTSSYDAVQVLKMHRYEDKTPDVSLLTRKVFENSLGVKYRFVGWDSDRPVSGPPYGIWMEEIDE